MHEPKALGLSARGASIGAPVPMENLPDQDEVVLRLTKAEALVLFEWLHRNEPRDEAKTEYYYAIPTWLSGPF
jgi:hypothetical protein